MCVENIFCRLSAEREGKEKGIVGAEMMIGVTLQFSAARSFSENPPAFPEFLVTRKEA